MTAFPLTELSGVPEFYMCTKKQSLMLRDRDYSVGTVERRRRHEVF